MHKVLLTMAASLGAAVIMSGSAMASTKPASRVHVVGSGESLSSIATAEKLDSWRPLWDANSGISDPDLIYIGEQLAVPNGPTTPRPLPAETVSAVPQSAGYSAAPRQVQRSAPAVSSGAAGGDVMARIRAREAGGNYATNTGNGYYGAYQFSIGTWQAVGGSGLPSQASPAEQDMRAAMLYQQRGCSPWPNTCY